jgi:hypothetical protein
MTPAAIFNILTIGLLGIFIYFLSHFVEFIIVLSLSIVNRTSELIRRHSNGLVRFEWPYAIRRSGE